MYMNANSGRSNQKLRSLWEASLSAPVRLRSLGIEDAMMRCELKFRPIVLISDFEILLGDNGGLFFAPCNAS